MLSFILWFIALALFGSVMTVVSYGLFRAGLPIFGSDLLPDHEYPDETLTHRQYSTVYTWSGISVAILTLSLLSDSGYVIGITFVMLIALTILSFRTVPEQERWVIEFLGTYFTTLGSGPQLIPLGFSIRSMVSIADKETETFLDGEKHTYTEINGKEFEVQPKRLEFTDDSAGIQITTITRVINPWKATYAVGSFKKALISRIDGNTRAVLTQLSLDDALQVRDGAARLIRSLFIKEQLPGEHTEVTRLRDVWAAINRLSIYDSTERWIPRGPGHPIRTAAEITNSDEPFNMMLAARECELPYQLRVEDEENGEEHTLSLFTIEEWGVIFRPDGIIVKDYDLRDETLKLRDDLLEANRMVRIAERGRQRDQIEGRGRRERLEEIRRGLGRGATGQDAASYDIADKVAREALPAADVTLVQENLALPGLAKLAGQGNKPRKNTSSSDNDENES